MIAETCEREAYITPYIVSSKESASQMFCSGFQDEERVEKE
jgi:hypothetical protein